MERAVAFMAGLLALERCWRVRGWRRMLAARGESAQVSVFFLHRKRIASLHLMAGGFAIVMQESLAHRRRQLDSAAIADLLSEDPELSMDHVIAALERWADGLRPGLAWPEERRASSRVAQAQGPTKIVRLSSAS